MTAAALRLRLVGCFTSGIGFLLNLFATIAVLIGWLSIRASHAQFVHQDQFLGPLAKLGLPVLTAAGVFVGLGGGVICQPRRLGIGLLRWINMLMPVPEPLMMPVGNRS